MVHRLLRLGLYTKELLAPELEDRARVFIAGSEPQRRVLGRGHPGLGRSASDTDLFHNRHSEAEHVAMCLLIGPTGSGKTLLLKRLNTGATKGVYTDLGDAPPTVPTVGTNLVTVHSTKKHEITVRELGGAMAPIWHNYYTDCQALMYVVDMSNRTQLSAACIQFYEVLTMPLLQSTPILLILNKTDVSGAMTRLEFDQILRMEDVLRHCTQPLTVMETSAKDGNGIPEVAKWIQEHARPPPY